jgi:hypothetical protein
VLAAAALELDAIGQVQASKMWMLCASVRLVAAWLGWVGGVGNICYIPGVGKGFWVCFIGLLCAFRLFRVTKAHDRISRTKYGYLYLKIELETENFGFGYFGSGRSARFGSSSLVKVGQSNCWIGIPASPPRVYPVINLR